MNSKSNAKIPRVGAEACLKTPGEVHELVQALRSKSGHQGCVIALSGGEASNAGVRICNGLNLEDLLPLGKLVEALKHRLE